MSSTQPHHQQLKNLLSQGDWDNAQALWLELAEQFSDQPEFLLLLVKEFADVGQSALAAELASLITDSIKASGKYREWLYALKLQAEAKHTDKQLRADIREAFSQIHQSDPRLKTTAAHRHRPGGSPFRPSGGGLLPTEKLGLWSREILRHHARTNRRELRA
jgi:hypothetical protein